jgi:uncharacterized protein
MMNLTLFFLLISSIPLYAVSFDCNKAGTKTEKAICSKSGTCSQLDELDNEVNRLYKMAKQDSDSIVNDQKKWLAERNKCADQCDCLVKSYESRQSQIISMIGESLKAGALALGTGENQIKLAWFEPFYSDTEEREGLYPNGTKDFTLFVKEGKAWSIGGEENSFEMPEPNVKTPALIVYRSSSRAGGPTYTIYTIKNNKLHSSTYSSSGNDIYEIGWKSTLSKYSSNLNGSGLTLKLDDSGCNANGTDKAFTEKLCGKKDSDAFQADKEKFDANSDGKNVESAGTETCIQKIEDHFKKSPPKLEGVFLEGKPVDHLIKLKPYCIVEDNRELKVMEDSFPPGFAGVSSDGNQVVLKFGKSELSFDSTTKELTKAIPKDYVQFK